MDFKVDLFKGLVEGHMTEVEAVVGALLFGFGITLAGIILSSL